MVKASAAAQFEQLCSRCAVGLELVLVFRGNSVQFARQERRAGNKKAHRAGCGLIVLPGELPLHALKAILMIASLTMYGCDSIALHQETRQAAAKQEPQEKQQEFNSAASVASLLEACLSFLPDTTLARTSVIPVTGDLRPFWRVSGRVQNTCPRELSDVTFSIVVYKKPTAEELDMSEFTLKGAITLYATRGIEENVHLRIAAKDWTWSITPTKAQIGPVQQR